MYIERKSPLSAIIASAETKKKINAEGAPGLWDRSKSVLAIDFETAHNFNEICNREFSSACQVGLAFYDAATGEVHTASSFIRPDPFKMDLGSSRIHGITLEMLEYAPSFEQVYEDLLLPYMRRSELLVAHNAPFDMRVLYNALQYYQLSEPGITCACTLAMAKQYLRGQKNGLGALCEAYGIELDHHEASSDALACLRVFEKFSDEGFEYFGRSIEKMMQSRT